MAACLVVGCSSSESKPAPQAAKPRPANVEPSPAAAPTPEAEPDAKAEPAVDPAVESAIAESAIVVAANGLQLIDVKTSKRTTAFEGRVTQCLSQPAAAAVWFIGRAEGAESDSLWVVDGPRGPEPIELATNVPEGVSALAVHTWRGGTSATHTPDDFEVGLLLDLRSVPMTRRTLGCQSDRTGCFADPAAETLHPKLDELALAIEGVTLKDPGTAKRVGDRAPKSRRPQLPKPLGNLEVAPEACRDEAVDCGRRVEIPGLPYHLVVTGNDRGDVFHESLQLYDPVALTYASLVDPTQTSKTPLAEGTQIARLFVAESGQAYAIDDRVVHLSRGTLVSGIDVCGFTSPGAVLTGVTK